MRLKSIFYKCIIKIFEQKVLQIFCEQQILYKKTAKLLQCVSVIFYLFSFLENKRFKRFNLQGKNTTIVQFVKGILCAFRTIILAYCLVYVRFSLTVHKPQRLASNHPQFAYKYLGTCDVLLCGSHYVYRVIWRVDRRLGLYRSTSVSRF